MSVNTPEIQLVRGETVVQPDDDAREKLDQWADDPPEAGATIVVGKCDCTVRSVAEGGDSDDYDYRVVIEDTGRNGYHERRDALPTLGESVDPESDGPFDVRLWEHGSVIATELADRVPDVGEDYRHKGETYLVTGVAPAMSKGREAFNVHLEDTDESPYDGLDE